MAEIFGKEEKFVKRILLQGAMDSELSYYMEQECFRSVRVVSRNGFEFQVSRQGEKEIILSKTGMGMTNAALATMTAVTEFHPDVILNQGTAGAHVKSLKRGDMVIGRQAVNVHSLEMTKRDFGEGMVPEQWKGMATEYIDADKELVRWFEQEMGVETRTGKVVTGILGSGDLFSKEKDRILWLHEKFGNLSEDMETFAVYAACRACCIPCVAIRVISNNELLDEDYDEYTAVKLQREIWSILEKGKKNPVSFDSEPEK